MEPRPLVTFQPPYNPSYYSNATQQNNMVITQTVADSAMMRAFFWLGFLLYFFSGIIPGIIIWMISGCYLVTKKQKSYKKCGRQLICLSLFGMTIFIILVSIGCLIGVAYLVPNNPVKPILIDLCSYIKLSC